MIVDRHRKRKRLLTCKQTHNHQSIPNTESSGHCQIFFHRTTRSKHVAASTAPINLEDHILFVYSIPFHSVLFCNQGNVDPTRTTGECTTEPNKNPRIAGRSGRIEKRKQERKGLFEGFGGCGGILCSTEPSRKRGFLALAKRVAQGISETNKASQHTGRYLDSNNGNTSTDSFPRTVVWVVVVLKSKCRPSTRSVSAPCETTPIGQG